LPKHRDKATKTAKWSTIRYIPLTIQSKKRSPTSFRNTLYSLQTPSGVYVGQLEVEKGVWLGI